MENKKQVLFNKYGRETLEEQLNNETFKEKLFRFTAMLTSKIQKNLETNSF